jgi:tyrosyl-tRNA synthetase
VGTSAGIDLCRKKLGRHVFGLTLPLVTKADGTKFGNWRAVTVWLDAKRTSVYKFYQFWIQTEDAMVVRHQILHVPLPRNRGAGKTASKAGSPRRAQRWPVPSRSSSTAGRPPRRHRASEILFGGGLKVFPNRPSTRLSAKCPPGTSLMPGSMVGAFRWPKSWSIRDSAPARQARKDIEGGGIYVNNVREAATRARSPAGISFSANTSCFAKANAITSPSPRNNTHENASPNNISKAS